jgi:DNA-binding IclR family transcriptional regulator
MSDARVQSVQSLERAFAILAAVAAEPAGVTAIAERVQLPKSTVARLLGALERLDAVERQPGATWRVGPGIGALAADATPARSLVALARPHLAALAADLGEDAGLALPDGHAVLYVDQAASDNPVQVRDWTGTRVPMHAVPSGLVLLAEWPSGAIDAYVADGLPRFTSRTIGDAATLQQRLAEVRAAGHAWGREEFAEGITSVAAPVHDPSGHAVAAVHVHGPSYRFPPPGREEDVATCVEQAARTLEAG